MAERTRLLVDCDTGIDDALALLYLAADPEVEIAAVGSVHGNIPAELAATNTLRVLEIAGLREVPVAVGAHRPMAQPLDTAERVHGKNGLGGVELPEPREALQPGSAVEQLVRLARAHPGEFTLLATGPLTNLGAALLIEPDLPRLIPRVVLMGGAVIHPGNVTALAEANIWHDPEAADLVFQAPWAVTMVPLDVTMQTLLRRPQLQRLAAATSRTGHFAWEILQHYLDSYERSLGERACPLHDPLAAGIALDPGLAGYLHKPVHVDLRGSESRGATVVDRRQGPRVQPSSRPSVAIAMEVDADGFVERLLHRLGV